MGPCKSAKSSRALQMRAILSNAEHIEIIVLAVCWRLSAFKSPSYEKNIFLKIRSFFSFKFFRATIDLLTTRSLNFMVVEKQWHYLLWAQTYKHWRFCALGTFYSVLVCYDTAFLFSTRAMTALGCLPIAHRDMTSLRCHDNSISTNVLSNIYFYHRCNSSVPLW